MNKRSNIIMPLLSVCLELMAVTASGSVLTISGKALREAVEASLKRAPSKGMARLMSESPESIARVMSRYGDDGIRALDQFGRPAMKVLLDNPDDVGRSALRMFGRHGDDAVRMAQHPGGLRVLATESDTMFSAMVKTRNQGYPILSRYGERGATALNNLSPGQRRQLIHLDQAKHFSASDFEKLLEVAGRYGNRGLEFVWQNKGALLVAGTAVAFWSDPEPYINGVMQLGAGRGTGVPEPVKRINMTAVVLSIIGLFGARMAIREWWRYRRENAQLSNNAGKTSEVKS